MVIIKKKLQSKTGTHQPDKTKASKNARKEMMMSAAGIWNGLVISRSLIFALFSSASTSCLQLLQNTIEKQCERNSLQ